MDSFLPQDYKVPGCQVVDTDTEDDLQKVYDKFWELSKKTGREIPRWITSKMQAFGMGDYVYGLDDGETPQEYRESAGHQAL